MNTTISIIFLILQLVIIIGGFYLIITGLVKSKEKDKWKDAFILFLKMFGILLVVTVIKYVLILNF